MTYILVKKIILFFVFVLAFNRNDGPNLILKYSKDKQSYVDVSVDREDFLPVRDIYGNLLRILKFKLLSSRFRLLVYVFC